MVQINRINFHFYPFKYHFAYLPDVGCNGKVKFWGKGGFKDVRVVIA